ncbi:molybdopterin-guanine dinucleotide biosynthesis protein B [Caldichromatium japonicum]|uniref:Molybdopterin-guanine dinucleotide biosynthesis protein B n=1 Tax=Caldichromatium japonicum TaxID=2699430 RepID=A0A6G7VDG9_9GAMM|nr:molybdopterin-guanine dinucleotide biosynthesis protein B [Caldichromatium japonicum]QIK37950.1 molybdopterin-guanine dinucleotide biosynthesis protein B [Caldichromatium japonicum]
MNRSPLPVIGFVAPSGTGKTTLIRRLLSFLRAQGIRVGYLKHTHHRFDLDQPGKDSFEVRSAGASQVILASRLRWALLVENEQALPEPDLWAMLARFDPTTLDLVLAEGFKHERYPKIEVYRAAINQPPLYPQDPDIIALVTDDPPPVMPHPPVLAFAQIEVLAALICKHLGLSTQP